MFRSVSAAACALVLATAVAFSPPGAAAQLLTIYQIQYTDLTTNPDGTSEYHDQVVDCLGGIVVARFGGSRPRLILQDPDYPDGWGAIQAKDWIYPFDMFNDAQLGDWVSFENMLAEDFRGTTFLERESAYSPVYSIVSQGNPLPPSVIVSAAAIPAPIEHPGDEWYVEDHLAEPYESMRLVIRDVTVTAKDYGKAQDNYNLQTPGGDNVWAADYMNEDVEADGYHPFVEIGQHFCAVAGAFEQYTYLDNGWDYYQLITMTTVDLAICADGNSDGQVSLDDVPRFAECLIGPACEGTAGGCNPPAWTAPPADLPLQHCLMMDLDYDGDVDLGDFAGLQRGLGAH